MELRIDLQEQVRRNAGASGGGTYEMEESQRDAIEQAMGKFLLHAKPLGLGPGDRYNGSHWIRDMEDEEIELPITQEQS